MSRFMNHMVMDLRSGHETWRVFLALCGSAFATAVLLTILRSF